MGIFVLMGCDSNVDVDDGSKNNDKVSDFSTNDNLEDKISDIIDNELYMYIKYKNVVDITNQDKLWFMYNMYMKKGGSNSFDASLLQEEFTNSVLIDLGYKNDDIYYQDSDEMKEENIYVKYDIESNKYSYNSLFDKNVSRKVVRGVKRVDSFTKENNRYIVKVKYLFVVDDGNMSFPMDVYGKWEDAYNGVNKVDTINVLNASSDSIKDVFNYLNSNYSNISSLLDTYTYIFTYNNNKIKLVDFERE